MYVYNVLNLIVYFNIVNIWCILLGQQNTDTAFYAVKIAKRKISVMFVHKLISRSFRGRKWCQVIFFRLRANFFSINVDKVNGRPLSLSNKNNKVIYTAQIRRGRKCAFSRKFWRGKFSIYLLTMSGARSSTGRLFDTADRWPGNSGRRSTSLFVECEADANCGPESGKAGAVWRRLTRHNSCVLSTWKVSLLLSCIYSNCSRFFQFSRQNITYRCVTSECSNYGIII